MIDLAPVDLKLARTFATSRSRTTESRSYFVREGGAVGEAAPVRFYGETPATLEAAWPRLRSEITDELDPRVVWPRLDRALGYQFALKCGIDLFLWDRYGRAQGAPVQQLLQIEQALPVATAFSIGIGPSEVMQLQVRERPDFRVYKVKVGFDGDVDAIAAVRQATKAPLYVDANGGWGVEEACQKLPLLEKMGVVLCEQPIFSGHRADWERVRSASGMPVIADEYIQRPEDVAHWDGWVDGINVKLQKCGGITPALHMIQVARDLGLRVMIGCMIESSVGIAAAAQLAPLADYIDLDSNQYLENDPYDGIPCRQGLLFASQGTGLGVRERQRVAC